MNLTGFVCVLCNWRNKFQIQRSERRVFLRLVSNFLWLIVSLVRAVLIQSSNILDVYFLVLLIAPLLLSCFDLFCDLFSCIATSSFELRMDVASLELTFGYFDCFVRRLFPLLSLPFAVVFFSSCRGSSTEIEISVIRITVRWLQFLLKNLANQSTPTKSWNLAPNRNNLPTEDTTNSSVYKITFADETHLQAGRYLFLDSAE